MKKFIPLKNRIISALKKFALFLFNPKLLLCVGIAWLITNGWCYIFVALGTAFGITWMTVAGAAYMGFLWFPFTPEKLVTLLIAIGLMRLFFPNDEKTLGVLKEKYELLKKSVREQHERFVEKRRKRKKEKAERKETLSADLADKTI